MKFKVQNLGIIEEAEVDLSKDLILLCGQNNTGKTYLAYAIYFLFESISRRGYGVKKELVNNLLSELLHNKEIKIYLKDEIKRLKEISDFEERFSEDVKYYFSNFLSTDAGFDATISFDWDFLYHKSFNKEMLLQIKHFNDYLFIILKTKKTDYIEINLQNAENFLSKKEDVAAFQHALSFAEKIIHEFNPQIFTSERSAINIFSKELSLTKNKLFDKILKSNDTDLLELARTRVNRYPKPIIDSLEIAEDLLNLSKNKSEFAYLAEELEKIMGGKVAVSEYGDLRYKPNNSKSQNLEMHLSSSLVKSLSSLAFYLRHLAQKNDVIMIDEPELNLHPDNQRKIARFFGRLVNEGFKVIISTHSDYIIKEINNLIMLSKESKHTKSLLKKFKYNENEVIKPSQVEALLFRQNSGKNGKVIPEKIEITETGLSVKTIDEVIDDLDNTIEAIYFKLFESDNDE